MKEFRTSWKKPAMGQNECKLFRDNVLNVVIFNIIDINEFFCLNHFLIGRYFLLESFLSTELFLSYLFTYLYLSRLDYGRFFTFISFYSYLMPFLLNEPSLLLGAKLYFF